MQGEHFQDKKKNGVTIRLNASTEDELQIIIQDDLSEMIGGQMIVQGYVVDKIS